VRNRIVPTALTALTALTATACNAYYNAWSPDDLMKSIPWFDHMIKSRMVSPYSRADVPRYTVPGTVPITGAEANWEAEWKANNQATADRQVNPIARDSALDRGDTLFHTFCAVCHGGTAEGNGPVSAKFGGNVPSLLIDKARNLSDGYIYSMIRYGRGNMPRYGDKVYRREDRWAIVNYVRQLQHGAGADTLARGRTGAQP
jgi:mono/diheme cytochrome c family protein